MNGLVIDKPLKIYFSAFYQKVLKDDLLSETFRDVTRPY